MTDLVTTQIGTEIALVGTPAITTTQIGVEVAFSLVPALVVSQIGFELAFIAGGVTAQQRVMVMA